jgi:transposase
MGRMTLITGEERRRRWSNGQRAQILTAFEEPGAVIADVARRADVCTSLVYKWRREARKAASDSGFARVIVEDPLAGRPSLPPPSPTQNGAEPGVIVVQIKDALIRIGINAPSALITATLKALRS